MTFNLAYAYILSVMRTLNFRLIGTSPLLLHRTAKHQHREHIASNINHGERFEEEALEVMSKDAVGNPAVPVSWLWDAIRVGCSRITVEGKQISYVKVSAVMSLGPKDFLSLKSTDGRTPEWRVYKSVQHAGPSSKKSILVVAPEFRDWALEVMVRCHLDFPDDELLLKIFTEAGRVGIGLFHPPKKHFGQFRCGV